MYFSWQHLIFLLMIKIKCNIPKSLRLIALVFPNLESNILLYTCSFYWGLEFKIYMYIFNTDKSVIFGGGTSTQLKIISLNWTTWDISLVLQNCKKWNYLQVILKASEPLERKTYTHKEFFPQFYFLLTFCVSAIINVDGGIPIDQRSDRPIIEKGPIDRLLKRVL